MLQPIAHKKVILVVLALFFLVITGLMFYSSQENEKGIWAEKIFRMILYPFQKAFYYITSFVAETWETLTELASLHRENDELQKNLSRLTAELSQLEQLRAENERLREMLQFKVSSELELVPTEVIARNPSNQNATFIIDKGKNHGFTRNMPVITEQGVAGRLLNVGPFSAEVILLVDPRAGNSMSGVI
ncbi:MAG: rod shape-determining protein MreC, partial [Firmicutes bacterium]|nr:rod shape-determining protein MreC [Bacillota bacterium]